MSRKLLIGSLSLVGVLLSGTNQSWAAGPPPNPTNSDANGNTAGGSGVLVKNNGSFNTGFGLNSLFNNSSGFGNSGFGVNTLTNTTIGLVNTAVGLNAMINNTAGNWGTGVGVNALVNNQGGQFNTAVGGQTGLTNANGNFITLLGFNADVAADNFSNTTALGAFAQSIGSNSIVLGNNAITKIYAQVTTITGISDKRLKKDIDPLKPNLGLSFIESLKPVTYKYNNGDETTRFGFIAQDLKASLPSPMQHKVETAKSEHGIALVERGNDKDRTYRASYDELIAPIVKAIQEQQQQINELRAQNQQLRNELAAVKTGHPVNGEHTAQLDNRLK